MIALSQDWLRTGEIIDHFDENQLGTLKIIGGHTCCAQSSESRGRQNRGRRLLMIMVGCGSRQKRTGCPYILIYCI